LDQINAFDVRVDKEVLVIDLRSGFDFGGLHAHWAQNFIVLHPGPFREIRFDLSRCVDISSTLFAGLLQLQQHYSAQKTESFVLLNPGTRVLKNLNMLRVDKMFIIRQS
jgi:hypothetical protein